MEFTTPNDIREWVADFETTTQANYERDGCVRVFLWHARRLFLDEEEVGYDIDSFLEFLSSGRVKKIWFHNLKFDGSFILNRILQLGWTESPRNVKGINTYSHIITGEGQWMVLNLRFSTGTSNKSRKNNCVVKICDSLKKFPGFSLEQIAKIYGIKGKSSLYTGYRPSDYVVTEEDIERVRGDTRILKTAMEDLFNRGMTALTMSGDAMRMYQTTISKKTFDTLFPKLSLEMDAVLRKAYKGGWTYVNPIWTCETVQGVKVYDVNSMYPWAMYNCPLPYGKPFISKKEPPEGVLFIIECSCAFDLREGCFPSIQLKGNMRYGETEYLAHSDGVTDLVLTSVDWELFKENYDITALTVKRYICFKSAVGMFKDYIDYWMAVKEKASAEGDSATKATAKRMLNSLYGKFGMNPHKTSKVAHLEDGVLRWEMDEEDGDGGYVPVAAFITAYGRARIIRSAQLYGDAFVYADTDSVHVLSEEHLLEEHPTRLGAFKLESESEYGKYLRPKTYIHAHRNYIAEFFTGQEEYEVEDVKCAGMPDDCKKNVDWYSFRLGAEYEGKLSGRQVPGGYCLIDVPYKIKTGSVQYG